MTLLHTFEPEFRCDPDKARDLGERYHLGHPAEYVVMPTGTVHLRQAGSRRTICGTLIPLDGQKLPRYTTTGDCTCIRCGQVIEKALDRAYGVKRAK
ncbi:hypothetical protein [Deinococcus humi]|uniref:Uncharacterized protein n=1 Tax=Deinococcus humi TaxID=662880 RepID=A0A7W8JW70_9DEIO|nr:hypothetical protein [Deinococcus humi]MBB5363063.1 hypothetical protein [Deinococcus humi]GGO24896.1 hypothetical protein GCM10008949_14220 [Deinococcus humi]